MRRSRLSSGVSADVALELVLVLAGGGGALFCFLIFTRTVVQF